MSDDISSADRALIEQHLKENGVTKIATGASSHPGWTFSEKENRLISNDPEMTSWRGSSRGKKPDPKVYQRRQRLREHMISGGSAIAFARKEKISKGIVYTDAKFIGRSFLEDAPDTRKGMTDRLVDRFDQIRKLTAQGVPASEQRKIFGISKTTYYKNVKKMKKMDAENG